MATTKAAYHIGILYLKEGAEWAQYLKTQFLKDKRLELAVVLLNLEQENSVADVTKMTSSCYVTILLMTPDITTWQTNNQNLDNYLKVIPQHRGIVALSAFIDDIEYSEIQKVCTTSSRWTPMTLTEKVPDNIKMVAEIIDLVEEVEKADKKKQAPLPKKRTTLEKPKIPVDLESPTNVSAPEVRDIFPSKVFTAREKVVIVFKDMVNGTVHVSYKDNNNEIHDTKKINPYTFTFRTPDPSPTSNMVEIYLDGKKIASKRLLFVKPTLSALQCIGYLMQTLGVETTDELDQRLCDMFERTVPRDDILSKLFSSEEIQMLVDSTVKSMNDFPTLLHFAAAHGLSDFTSLLLEQPGSMAAFNIVNHRNQNPADMAEANQHHDLASYITDFTDTHAVIDACGIYVSMAAISEDIYIDMSGKLLPSSSEDLYSKSTDIIPDPEDEEPEVDEAPPPLPPARSVSLPPVPPQHRKLSLDSTSTLPSAKATRTPLTAPPTPTRPKDATCPPAIGFQNPASFLQYKEPTRELSASAMGSMAQQELIDIQTLVKTNDYTIDEAVMIFNSWKERPASQSFKDRKKNLEELKSKASMVAPQREKSLFKRLVSFRKLKRQEETVTRVTTAEAYETYSIPNQFLTQPSSIHRVSSLSNSSSSSGTSRESGVSLKEVVEIPSSDSEAEEQPPTRPRRRNRSDSGSNAEKRKSKKDMFLEGSIDEKELKLPPLPPRRKAKSPTSSQSPPQLPKPRGTR